ncbi:MAG TPA: trypsin-like peptidase domain-containing protein [Patescibacteria group bacterium]|nr:trypsin-like peptidase domain-containing protein [Patescibacteria group bacterium]
MTASPRKPQKFLLFAALILILLGGIISAGWLGLNWSTVNQLLPFLPKSPSVPSISTSLDRLKVVSEENVIIDAVEKVSPSVVTVGISQTRRVGDIFEFNPFDPFSPFERRPGRSEKVEQDIGSGFVISSDGLIVTNKHVVSVPDAKYRVITKDDKSYDVVKIYRDPDNDLAIVKINATDLRPIELGDSDKIKVGQMAIAIGTALGEFRNTVTVGVISGVGRGITAGGPFDGFAEKLDNVIQTDAAINPGNSGGPLLNSSGQVIGVNTAVSADGQNIGFALPINVVKDAVANFNSTGQFNRPFLGVEYRMISRQMAVLNEIPEGAYIMDVVDNSPADSAGVEPEDIMTKIDGVKVTDSNDLAKIIGKKKVGDTVELTVWRNEKEISVKVILGTQE